MGAGLGGNMGCGEAGPARGRTLPVRVEGPSEEAEGVLGEMCTVLRAHTQVRETHGFPADLVCYPEARERVCLCVYQ